MSIDLKTWTEISDQIQLPKGIRHGTIFKITSTELDKIIQSTDKN